MKTAYTYWEKFNDFMWANSDKFGIDQQDANFLADKIGCRYTSCMKIIRYDDLKFLPHKRTRDKLWVAIQKIRDDPAFTEMLNNVKGPEHETVIVHSHKGVTAPRHSHKCKTALATRAHTRPIYSYIQYIYELCERINDKGNTSEKSAIEPIRLLACEHFQSDDQYTSRFVFLEKVQKYKAGLREDHHGNFESKLRKIADLIEELGERLKNSEGNTHGNFITNDRLSELHSLLVKLRAA